MALRSRHFHHTTILLTSLIAPLVSSIALGDDDEPRGLGRLFRMGNRNQAAREADVRSKRRPIDEEPQHPPHRPNVADPSRLLRSQPGMAATPGSASLAPYGSLTPRQGNGPAQNPTPPDLDREIPALGGLPTDVGAPASSNPGPRLVPQPRSSRPMSEAPPLLTRVQIGRSDDGQTFGMFLQIFSDGTVVDTEGVHKVGRDVLQPLVEALRAADAGRIRGHCGSPPTDFVEQVMLVVYDQNRGRLQANHFSYSGNTQGCNPAIRKLQDAIDAVQNKISAGATPVTTPASLRTEAAPPVGSTPLVPPDADAAPAPPVLGTPALPNPSPPRLELTPVGEGQV